VHFAIDVNLKNYILLNISGSLHQPGILLFGYIVIDLTAPVSHPPSQRMCLCCFVAYKDPKLCLNARLIVLSINLGLNASIKK